MLTGNSQHALDHCFHEQLYQPDCSSQADVALALQPVLAVVAEVAVDGDARLRPLRMRAKRVVRFGLVRSDQASAGPIDLMRSNTRLRIDGSLMR
jgi:hypothetical protein